MSWTTSQSSAGVAYAVDSLTTFVTDTNNGTFVLYADLSGMANGDLFAIRCLTAVGTSTTPKQVWKGTWKNSQTNGLKVSPPIASTTVFTATISSDSTSNSTTATYPWALLRI